MANGDDGVALSSERNCYQSRLQMRASRADVESRSSGELVAKLAVSASGARSTAHKTNANASRCANDDCFWSGAGGPNVSGQIKTANIASATNVTIANLIYVFISSIFWRMLHDGNRIRE